MSYDFKFTIANRNQEKLIDDLMFGEENAEQILEQHKEQVKETKKTLFSHAGIKLSFYLIFNSHINLDLIYLAFLIENKH